MWVVPTLAASGFIAASIGSGGPLTQRVDEDGDDGPGGGDEDTDDTDGEYSEEA